MLENIMDILGRETEGLTPELFYYRGKSTGKESPVPPPPPPKHVVLSK